MTEAHTSFNPYEILGIDRDATEEEIKSAYHRMAHLYHPDKNKRDSDAEERFKTIQNAYEYLVNRVGSPGSAKRTSPPPPLLVIFPPIFDFGNVVFGKKITCSFEASYIGSPVSPGSGLVLDRIPPDFWWSISSSARDSNHLIVDVEIETAKIPLPGNYELKILFRLAGLKAWATIQFCITVPAHGPMPSGMKPAVTLAPSAAYIARKKRRRAFWLALPIFILVAISLFIAVNYRFYPCTLDSTRAIDIQFLSATKVGYSTRFAFDIDGKTYYFPKAVKENLFNAIGSNRDLPHWIDNPPVLEAGPFLIEVHPQNGPAQLQFKLTPIGFRDIDQPGGYLLKLMDRSNSVLGVYMVRADGFIQEYISDDLIPEPTLFSEVKELWDIGSLEVEFSQLLGWLHRYEQAIRIEFKQNGIVSQTRDTGIPLSTSSFQFPNGVLILRYGDALVQKEDAK